MISPTLVGALSCCQRLADSLPNEVFFRSALEVHPSEMDIPVGQAALHNLHSRSGGVYMDLNSNRWSDTAILAPGCIFQPTSTEALSKGVIVLTSEKGLGVACQFSIKSGGHCPIPGANNIYDGVSIDLGRLNSVTLSDNHDFVRLGAGGTWGQAYAALDGTGFAFPGGACGTTGIGGVSLGGGQSLFQPRVGWVVDNILNFEVVLASGEIVNANISHNSDLFRALKGGGNNFGIVTHVNVKGFAFEDKIWAGQILVPALKSNVQKTLSGIVEFTKANNENPSAALQVVFANYHSGLSMIDIAPATTDGTVDPPIFKSLTSIWPRLWSTMKQRTLNDLVQELDKVQPKGYRQSITTISSLNDFETILEIHSLSEQLYNEVKLDVRNLDWISFYIPQPKIIQQYANATGGNMLGLAESAHDQIVLFLSPRWTDSADDATMNQVTQKWYQLALEVTKRRGTDDPFLYSNFAGQFQRPLCGYGPDNLAFLKQVSRKYDPHQVFQNLVPGGHKLNQHC
ncbi:6-hydroxy-D-nicotine oxidase [Xylariales sp. PMI_506]|nr:6-hydroxy-D-nicotine oxidase [Xylariales sp. PMI_506]